MEARANAFILCLALNIPILAMVLSITDGTLLTLLLIVMFTTSTVLLGFSFSPDARPPKIPPRTRTARTVLIPLGSSALSATIDLLTGYHTLSYYIESQYLPLVAFFSLTWLLGAFAARRLDSHRTRPEASYDVLLREYHKTENEPENPA